jgi:hypothetical protein
MARRCSPACTAEDLHRTQVLHRIQMPYCDLALAHLLDAKRQRGRGDGRQQIGAVLQLPPFRLRLAQTLLGRSPEFGKDLCNAPEMIVVAAGAGVCPAGMHHLDDGSDAGGSRLITAGMAPS